MMHICGPPVERSCRFDVAEYVRCAIDPAEEDAFTDHLADCQDCVRDIIWISDVFSRLDATYAA